MKKVKRLYSEFRPEHYELYLEPDREKAVFSGKVTISGQKVGRPSQRITLHQSGLKIKSAKLTRLDKKAGPTEISVDRINTHKSLDELRLHAKQQLFPGDYVIEVEFSGKITAPMHGIYPCNFELGGKKKQLIATQFESHHAREAFPCIDEPEAKATFSLTLVHPAAETAISNTPIKSQKNVGGQAVTEFEVTPKMSTYLLAFAYGELDFKESKTASGIKIRVYATPDKVKLTDFALKTAVRSLEFFEDYYGVAYPLPKMDLIGLPDFSAGAMENWGLVTFRESLLYVDPKSSSIETKQYVAMVISHEFAHQWFGNLVTMKWWNDIWLNESFAEMMGYLAVDALFPEWNFWSDFARREVSSALNRDSLPNVQAVQTEVNHPDELSTIFDPSIVYAKGAALINTIRNLIGEADFRKGLKAYFTEYKYSNTVADDLWRHLKTASGADIEAVMKNWLQKPGFPVVEVDYDKAKKAFTANQRRLVASPKPAKDSTLWQVPLAASHGLDKPMLTRQSDVFKITDKQAQPLTLNHNGQSYFVTQYKNKDHLTEILTGVEKGIISAIDRLLLIQNCLLLERAGRTTTLENIKLLPAYQSEREDAVWAMLAGVVGNARKLIEKDLVLESKLNDFVRPLIKPLANELGWRTNKNEPAQTQKLRSLILSLMVGTEDQPAIKQALRLFKTFKTPADLASDIRPVVYYAAVRFGTTNNFDQLVKLHNSSNNADERDEIAAELTATRDPKQVDRLLSMVTGEHVRLQDAPTWFGLLLRNRYATEQAWQWLLDNWSWVEKNYSSDKSYDRFPRYAGMVFSRPAELKKYKAFFEPKKNIALERSIQLGAEEIEGRIAWRQANEQPVKDWLSNQLQ
ncbi:MAG TPA: M1 family metallopeptidase [Candidatus Saccharimonadales bacterium]|nr:M1 family metallopeptidase [Candidatus Saccharimonadales bacterium]